MSQIFNLKIVKENLDEAEVDVDVEGNSIQRYHLGTVFNLYPSGKFYTPWANNNVAACTACRAADFGPCDDAAPCIPPSDYKGKEPYHCEVCRDMQWLNQAAEELETIGAFLESGEGDPCDLFASRIIAKEQTIQ